MTTRVLVALGTRPEAIKLAPVMRQLKNAPDAFEARLCVTAQHREMLDQMLQVFELRPDADLNLMRSSQTLAQSTARILTGMTRVLQAWRPDWLVVQGDTTTAMASALAAFYLRTPVAHVEAGLRTGDCFAPFPEEINRRIADTVAGVHFAPTERAAENLRRESIPESSIVVTGNTGVDALLYAVGVNRPSLIDALLGRLRGLKVITVTAHRRESFGPPLERICRAIVRVAARFPKDVHVVYPVHLNPSVQRVARKILGQVDNISLIEPLDYVAFAKLLQASHFLMTDSGGIQEEAPSLGKPVLVLREITERPEAVEAGTAEVVGTSEAQIEEAAVRLLTSPAAYNRMVASRNPFGDGRASERIVLEIARRTQMSVQGALAGVGAL